MARKSVRAVTQRGEDLEIFFLPGAKVDAKVIGGWNNFFGSRLSFLPSKSGDGIKISSVEDPLADISRAAAILAS